MNNEPNMNQQSPTVKRCPVCGKELPAQAAFCGECGYNFNAGDSPYTISRQPAVAQEDTSPLKMSDYLVMLLVSCIPLVNVILLLIWAFSSGVNVNRKNFCRAYLIVMVIAWILLSMLTYTWMGSL